MRTVFQLTAMLLAGLICASVDSRPQDRTRGSISGTIFDENGHPLAGVQVRAWKMNHPLSL
jgi:protocatechuate 3,4-dioxygenase beta subunit